MVGICAALIVLSGTIQVAHFHRDGKIDPNCSLCVTVHSAVHIVHPVTLQFSSHRVETVVLARRIHMPRAAVFFHLISRPPPTDSALFA